MESCHPGESCSPAAAIGRIKSRVAMSAKDFCDCGSVHLHLVTPKLAQSGPAKQNTVLFVYPHLPGVGGNRM